MASDAAREAAAAILADEPSQPAAARPRGAPAVFASAREVAGDLFDLAPSAPDDVPAWVQAREAVADDAAIYNRALEMTRQEGTGRGAGKLVRAEAPAEPAAAPAPKRTSAADFVAGLSDAAKAALRAELDADAGVDPYLLMADDERAEFDAANDADLAEFYGDDAA